MAKRRAVTSAVPEPSELVVDQKEGRYHHGKLRENLLRAALLLIEKQGVSGWTLREAARQAGVSHGAPYRHFRSKEELCLSVAVDGFLALKSFLAASIAAAGADPRERLIAAGRAHVRFALQQRAYYRVMYGQDLARTTPAAPATPGDGLRAELVVAAREAYRVFAQVVRECQKAGVVKGGRVSSHCLLAWSTMHGLAELLAAGLLPEAGALANVDALTQQLAHELLEGLAPR